MVGMFQSRISDERLKSLLNTVSIACSYDPLSLAFKHACSLWNMLLERPPEHVNGHMLEISSISQVRRGANEIYETTGHGVMYDDSLIIPFFHKQHVSKHVFPLKHFFFKGLMLSMLYCVFMLNTIIKGTMV